MILKKQRYENGKREIYIFETKVFEYYADKLKKPKDVATYLINSSNGCTEKTTFRLYTR